MTEQSEDGLGETQTTGDELQTNTSAGVESEDTFFDPSSLGDDPNLQAAYKQMQGAFTKKQQEAATLLKRYQGRDQDLALVDQFKQNPKAVIQQMAQQYGLSLAEQQQQEFNPQSWDDVIKQAEEKAYSRLQQEMSPLMQDLHNVKKQNIESYLDSKYSDWRNYESDMTSLVNQHPSLAKDPDLIYKMVVPQEALEKRAMQAAMKKVKGETETAQVTGQTTTSRKAPESRKAGSFQEAVQLAKEELAAQGMKPH